MKSKKLNIFLWIVLILFIVASLSIYIKYAATEQILDWQRLIPSLVIGIVLLIFGACIYLSIWLKHRDCLSPMKRSQQIVHLIAHVPDDSSSPWLHVIAGVTVCSGLCLLLGDAATFLVAPKYDEHGTLLTAAGLFFGILIAFISFWTLWQTKRIEQLQGANIEGFRTLTRSITSDMEELIIDFERHGRQASSHHRIYLVTTNPDFGGLSFPFTPDQENFYMALLKAADMVLSSNLKPGTDPFKLAILCGDYEAVSKFNNEWLTENGMTNRIDTTNARVERFIDELDNHAGKTPTNDIKVVKRKASIPEMQFAIIGHTVFEFILYIKEGGGRTGIAGARKIEDGLVCKRFIHYFNVLTGEAVSAPAEK